LNAEIVNVSGCKRNLLLEIPADELSRAIDGLAGSYAMKAKVPGFRPGKIPLSVIKQRYSSELRDEARQELISQSWERAKAEHKLDPISAPRVEDVRAEPGEPIRVTISFEILPSIDITEYKGVRSTMPEPRVEEAEVDQAIEQMLERQAQYIPDEEVTVRDGHMVTACIDGEFSDGGKPLHDDNINLVVGDPQTNDDFSVNLRGGKLGETRSFTVTFPADHPRTRFAGKTVQYAVQIKEIKRKELPQLNDEFARDLGLETLAGLRDSVRNELVRKAQRDAEEKAKDEILEQILQRLAFDVPECLIEEELHERAQRLAASFAYQGIDISKTGFNWKAFSQDERPQAEKSVRGKLVLDAIARKETLEVGDKDLDEEFERMSRASDKSAAALRAQFEKDQRIQRVRANLLRHKALDFVYRNANISRG